MTNCRHVDTETVCLECQTSKLDQSAALKHFQHKVPEDFRLGCKNLGSIGFSGTSVIFSAVVKLVRHQMTV